MRPKARVETDQMKCYWTERKDIPDRGNNRCEVLRLEMFSVFGKWNEKTLKFVLDFGCPPATTTFLYKPLWKNSQKSCLDLLSLFPLFLVPLNLFQADFGYMIPLNPVSINITSGLPHCSIQLLIQHPQPQLYLPSLKWPHLAISDS